MNLVIWVGTEPNYNSVFIPNQQINCVCERIISVDLFAFLMEHFLSSKIYKIGGNGWFEATLFLSNK